MTQSNKKTNLKKLLLLAALVPVALSFGMGEALATNVATTVTNLGAGVNQLPKLVAAMSMPVGLFLVILGGINLVKLGKEPNAEGVRNVVFTLLAGVFVLSLNWLIPYFRTASTLGTGASITNTDVTGAFTP